jgi:hypothetical protein
LHARDWAAGYTHAGKWAEARAGEWAGARKAERVVASAAPRAGPGRTLRGWRWAGMVGEGESASWAAPGRARAGPRWAGARGKWERRAGPRTRVGNAAGPRRGGARDGLVGQNGRAAQEGEEGLSGPARGREGWAFSFSLLFPLSSLLSFISFPALHLNLGLVLIQIQPRSRF